MKFLANTIDNENLFNCESK